MVERCEFSFILYEYNVIILKFLVFSNQNNSNQYKKSKMSKNFFGKYNCPKIFQIPSNLLLKFYNLDIILQKFTFQTINLL